LEGNSGGLIETLFKLLPGGTEEITKYFSQDGRCAQVISTFLTQFYILTARSTCSVLNCRILDFYVDGRLNCLINENKTWNRIFMNAQAEAVQLSLRSPPQRLIGTSGTQTNTLERCLSTVTECTACRVFLFICKPTLVFSIRYLSFIFI
jgi:hypothetical protein